MIGDGADVEDIERHVGAPRLDVDDAAFAKGVPYADFIEDVGVIDAHIRDAQVRQQQLLEHVGQDIAARRFFICAERLKARHLQGRLDHLGIDGVEIIQGAICPFLFAKGHDDKGMRAHLRTDRPGGGICVGGQRRGRLGRRRWSLRWGLPWRFLRCRGWIRLHDWLIFLVDLREVERRD